MCKTITASNALGVYRELVLDAAPDGVVKRWLKHNVLIRDRMDEEYVNQNATGLADDLHAFLAQLPVSVLSELVSLTSNTTSDLLRKYLSPARC